MLYWGVKSKCTSGDLPVITFLSETGINLIALSPAIVTGLLTDIVCEVPEGKSSTTCLPPGMLVTGLPSARIVTSPVERAVVVNIFDLYWTLIVAGILTLCDGLELSEITILKA